MRIKDIIIEVDRHSAVLLQKRYDHLKACQPSCFNDRGSKKNPNMISKMLHKWNKEGIRQHINQWFVRRNVQNITYGIPLNDLITGVDEYIFWFDYAYKKAKENHKEVIKHLKAHKILYGNNYYTVDDVEERKMFLQMAEDGVKLFKDRLEEMQELRQWIKFRYEKRSDENNVWSQPPKFKHIWWMQNQESLEYCVDTEKEIVECA